MQAPERFNDNVLQAAFELISKNGLRNVSISMIAETAEVDESQVSGPYPGIEQVAIAALRHLVKNTTSAMQLKYQNKVPSLDLVQTTIDEFFTEFIEDDTYVSFFIELTYAASNDPAMIKDLSKFKEEQNRLLLEMIHTSLGPLKDFFEIPFEKMVFTAETIFLGLMRQGALQGDREYLRKEFNNMKELLTRGLMSFIKLTG